MTVPLQRASARQGEDPDAAWPRGSPALLCGKRPDPRSGLALADDHGIGAAVGSAPADVPTAGEPGADAAVVAASLRQPELFGQIYHRHFDQVYRYLAARLGPDTADDLAAEVFLEAFRLRRSFDPARGAVRAWLFGIATNMAAHYRRAEARRYRMLAETAAGAAADHSVDGEADLVIERLAAQRLRQPLAAALARLPARERDALLLVTLGGLSYQEVAAALSIAPGTVGSRLTRARSKVRAALGDSTSILDGTGGM